MALHILIVDDEPDLEPLIRQKFRRNIRDGELMFTFARNGQEALEVLQADDSLAIVFTDINMPVMDGLTLLAKLAEQGRVIKTIMVSAYDDLRNIRTAMNRGAFDFLTKPIDFQDFEQTLKKTAGELAGIRESAANKEQLVALRSELAIASRIQQSILPAEFPSDRRFEIHAKMLPARTVSGDFYDFFPLGGTKMAFAIGDVSGKGVPAAIFMAVSRTLLRSAAALSSTTHDALRAVNDILLRQGNGEMSVTLFYGVLDATTGDVDFSIAGQTPPYIVSRDGGRRCLSEHGGTMIGLLEDPIIGSGSLSLKPGDTIFLFTDGITDAENLTGEPFGQKRLSTILAKCRGSAKDMVEQVFSAVEEFCLNAAQADDVTALALRYEGVENYSGLPAP